MHDPREHLCRLAESLYQRGLTHGSTGNVSMRLDDGRVLVSPTGSSLGFLEPEKLSVLDVTGRHIEGPKPTKEVPLHTAFYNSRPTGAVVHLHSCHATALSLVDHSDPDNWLPPLTPYSIMQLGKVKLVPYHLPGDPALGHVIRGLEGKHSAVMLANHGPVVSAKNLEAAVYAIEELEATAKLALMTRGMDPIALTPTQIQELVRTYDVEWDD